MDLCTKATSSNIENVVELPTFLNYQVVFLISIKVKGITISEMDPIGCNLEPMEKTEVDKNIDISEVAENPSCEATTNVVIPLTTNKVKNGSMKMAGCGVVATCDLF